MAINYTYIPDIPLATNKPSVDQPNMKINTNSINSIISTDHLTFGTATGTGVDGYHTVVHFQTNSGTPTTTTDYGQLYTNTVTPTGGIADQQLFYQSGQGVVTQLTGPNAQSPGNFGYTWIGEILMQWGFITLPGTSNPHGTVLFATNNIDFPNKCNNVQLSLNANAFTGQANTVSTIGTPSKTSFVWNFTGSTSYNFIYWFAIGF